MSEQSFTSGCDVTGHASNFMPSLMTTNSDTSGHKHMTGERAISTDLEGDPSILIHASRKEEKPQATSDNKTRSRTILDKAWRAASLLSHPPTACQNWVEEIQGEFKDLQTRISEEAAKSLVEVTGQAAADMRLANLGYKIRLCTDWLENGRNSSLTGWKTFGQSAIQHLVSCVGDQELKTEADC